MFDFDAGKLLILGVVALIVIGPKELPGVMRQVGQAVAKLRRMAAEFQSQFMEAMREAELDDLKKELASVQEAAKIDIDFNPVEDVKREMTAAVTPPIESPAAVASEPSKPIEPVALLPAQPSSEPKVEGVKPADAAAAPASAAPPGPLGTTPPVTPAGAPPLPIGEAGGAAPTTQSPAPGLPDDAKRDKRAGEAKRGGNKNRSVEDPSSLAVDPDGGEIAQPAKRKRVAKKSINTAGSSDTAAPEPRTRQRRKSGAP